MTFGPRIGADAAIDLSNKSLCKLDGAVIGRLLASNPVCTQLNLRNNELEDLTPVAAALRANTALRSLHLGKNSWAQSGVAELGRALQTNITLKVCYHPHPCL